jgi:hypothetical protein
MALVELGGWFVGRFYGICFGGFPIVGILGCLCGLYACRMGRGDKKRIAFITIGLAIAEPGCSPLFRNLIRIPRR